MAKKDRKAGNKEDQRHLPGNLEKPGERIAKIQPTLPPKAKPKSAAERRKDRIDGIIKTVYPSILGTAAGFACYHVASGLGDPWSLSVMGMELPWYNAMLLVIAVTFAIQKYTYAFMNIDAASFKTKDWIYVEFMVIDLWLVTWTLLLN
ncbi:MAG: hypothetical protein JW999_10380 [Methanotrichaceae archaeon]|nr:hypothetical protein [Methanotrichaceae archaeon]